LKWTGGLGSELIIESEKIFWSHCRKRKMYAGVTMERDCGCPYEKGLWLPLHRK